MKACITNKVIYHQNLKPAHQNRYFLINVKVRMKEITYQNFQKAIYNLKRLFLHIPHQLTCNCWLHLYLLQIVLKNRQNNPHIQQAQVLLVYEKRDQIKRGQVHTLIDIPCAIQDNTGILGRYIPHPASAIITNNITKGITVQKMMEYARHVQTLKITAIGSMPVLNNNLRVDIQIVY